MADDGVPEQARALLRDCIESFEQLEILLLLRLRPSRSWTPAGLAEEIKASPAIVAEALEHLRRVDLLERTAGEGDVGFRYRPGSVERDRAVQLLAQTYADKRIEIFRLLSENAVQRVRTSAIRMFADAFLIGRRKKDG